MKSKAANDMSRFVADQRKDEADKRQLRGKYAPPEGVCRAIQQLLAVDGFQPCGGRVVPLIRFPVQNLIGGTPPSAYVAYWHCEECGLMYHAPPKSKV